MKILDEETALSILFANTKRKKRNEDLITLAKSCEYLTKLYGSQKAVAERVGLSTEMIREFLTALKLPGEVQKLISDRKIDSIDIVREISVLQDPSKQVAAAKTFADSLSKDVRDIKRLIKDTSLSVAEAKKAVLESKPKGLHIFMMDFDDETYRSVIKQAKNMKVKPAELVKEIVVEWLKHRVGMEDK